MLVLLPPSEAKTPFAGGAPVDLAGLGAPGLTAHRSLVLDALIKVSAHPDAIELLGVGRSLAAEVERNTRLRAEPAGPASAVYSGVLYAAAGLHDLPDGAARDRAERSVRVVSALWGLVRPSDLIPAYRLSMGTSLPGIGPLARSWRGPLGAELDGAASIDGAAGGLIVDCRSAPYAAVWRPPASATGWVTVRVLRELHGRRSVVSHHAKHTRGVLTRHLLVRRGPEPTTPAELYAAARELLAPRAADPRAPDPRAARSRPLGSAPAGTDLIDVELATAARGAHVLTLTVA
ncbi:YaaA family protein [Pengzhenrongella sicca]|uniref:Peroxide stress protein YaaA n=1 Tax=Pengzhenrongella sicca TaxID=2819238 RepID=A0A8A4ZC28_9MICO|nr:peroxide stress protein YaaA [Pengzhenrongella sicca]QTE28433.1 peroxide stress protein YaaA [Pengzhenrongella sicca]